MIVFIVCSGLYQIISLFKFGALYTLRQNISKFVFSFLKPIIMVVVPSVVIMLFSGDKRKKLTTILSTVVVAYIPKIVSNILAIVQLLIIETSLVLSPVSTVLNAISIILLFYGVKELTEKEDDTSALNKFVLILIVSELILRILTSIGIYV